MDKIKGRVKEDFSKIVIQHPDVDLKKQGFTDTEIAKIKGLAAVSDINSKHVYNGSYLLRKHTLRGQDCFDIESKELSYSDCSPTHHGLQCNFNGGDERYKKIMALCDKLVEIVKEIDKLNTK